MATAVVADAQALTSHREHARLGLDPAFAETYADQNERDYAALQTAVKDGRAKATTEI